MHYDFRRTLRRDKVRRSVLEEVARVLSLLAGGGEVMLASGLAGRALRLCPAAPAVWLRYSSDSAPFAESAIGLPFWRCR